ncbi:lipoyltransferase-like protein [Coniochaeta sp. 2T2.1]|nr:lipoyltransferase-like protein [Coniochaeta sp. 2T2.1]
MSPHRHASITFTKPLTRLKQPFPPPFLSPYSVSSRPFTSHTSSHLNPLQIYHSTTTNPYLNLSIEHHLLTKSHPDSTLLFLYRNTPAVVIGRNQNPWLETNLSALRSGLSPSKNEEEEVALVRRRSGGGAVFHDLGNANWTVICPSAVFDRDRHAEMVVRALTRLGVGGVRVNERHDIVQDILPPPPSSSSSSEGKTFKVSGSAYKLTRLRSLHHGTCLLDSPNLGRISPLLRSPAEAYIKSRGVESVRSPVRNVGVGYEEFVDCVVEEFEGMYGEVKGGSMGLGEESRGIEAVRKGVEELQSLEWIYGQTPQFTFSTLPSEADPRPRPELPGHLPENLEVSFTVRHGQIKDIRFAGLKHGESPDGISQDQAISAALVGRTLHEIRDWKETLEEASPVSLKNDGVGQWLNRLFGIGRG